MAHLDNAEQDHEAERYLLGQMADEEQDRYLAQLLLHPERQAALDEARTRIKAVRGLHRPAPIKYWPWAVAGLVGILLYFAIRPSNPPQPKPNQAPPTPVQPAPNPTPAPTPQAPTPNAPVQRQPIATRFTPNPTLEYLVDAPQYRDANGAGLQWLQPPPKQPVFAQGQGQTLFYWEAKAVVPQTVATQLEWQIFDNRPEQYEAGQSVYRGTVIATPTPNSDTCRLSARTTLSLSKGLYYYLLENRETGELYFVGRFGVR